MALLILAAAVGMAPAHRASAVEAGAVDAADATAPTQEADDAKATTLEITPRRSTDGVYQLHWTAPGEVTIEEARDAPFAEPRVVYRGRDHATTLTGRSDGIYYYRVKRREKRHVESRVKSRAKEGTTAVSVEVDHHSAERALAFFGVGLFVFASTVVLIARGPDEEAAGNGSTAEAEPREGRATGASRG